MQLVNNKCPQLANSIFNLVERAILDFPKIVCFIDDIVIILNAHFISVFNLTDLLINLNRTLMLPYLKIKMSGGLKF